MAKNHVATSRYTYTHDDSEGLHKELDAHHILIRRSNMWAILIYLLLSIVLSETFFACLGKLYAAIGWSMLFSACIVFFFCQTRVVKESVVIMPAFGVQLETCFWSGRVVRNFIPMDNILKPVMNEHVTPFSCYWSLALVLKGRDELMLVFKEVALPMKVLVPVWKALCAASAKESADGKMTSHTYA